MQLSIPHKNPTKISPDYDEADRLYFENISLETVLDIYTLENSSGVVIVSIVRLLVTYQLLTTI